MAQRSPCPGGGLLSTGESWGFLGGPNLGNPLRGFDDHCRSRQYGLGFPRFLAKDGAHPGGMRGTSEELPALAGLLQAAVQIWPDDLQRWRALWKMCSCLGLGLYFGHHCRVLGRSPQDLQEIYAAGTKFIYVGPLLDKAGAKRAAGHRFKEIPVEDTEHADSDPVARLKEAKAMGRKVVYCSMGTVITGDSPEVGWEHRMKVENEEKGFTGKELCQAAWQGAVEALESQDALILISLGPQADALDKLTLPKNAFLVGSNWFDLTMVWWCLMMDFLCFRFWEDPKFDHR